MSRSDHPPAVPRSGPDELLRRRVLLFRKGNSALYRWYRESWRIRPRFWSPRHATATLDRPVFFVGTQGGGLTLLSRILRRHRDVVSATGNSDYWNGADELHRVAAPLLPPSLRLTGSAGQQAIGGTDSWLYACDEYLPMFRRTADQATEAERRAFTQVLRRFVYLHSRDPSRARFVDKSQTFAVKAGFVAALLREEDPHFILTTRNPYAMCLRAADEVLANRPWSREERLRRACQHWNNSMNSVLEDGHAGLKLMTLRFEDFLADPETVQRDICRFVDIPFEHALLPGPDDRPPLGGGLDFKWYPIRPAINARYWEHASPADLDVIEAICGANAERMGYCRPEVPAPA